MKKNRLTTLELWNLVISTFEFESFDLEFIL